MFKRSRSRGLFAQSGTSIVAALALVGLLSAALALTQILMPNVNTSSQSAAAITVAPKENTDKACKAAIAAAKSSGSTSATGNDVTDNCVAAIPDPTNKVTGYKCVGKTSVVSVSPESGTVTEKWSPNAEKPAGTCAAVACQSMITDGATSMKCMGVGSIQGLNNANIGALMRSDVPGAMTLNPEDVKSAYNPTTGLPLESQDATQLNNAFGPTTAQELDKQIANQKIQLDAANSELSALSVCAQSDFTGGCSSETVAASQANVQKQEEQLAALEAQKKDLAASAQNDLNPGRNSNNVGLDAFGNACGSPGADKSSCPGGSEVAVKPSGLDAFGNACGSPGADKSSCPGGSADVSAKPRLDAFGNACGSPGADKSTCPGGQTAFAGPCANGQVVNSSTGACNAAGGGGGNAGGGNGGGGGNNNTGGGLGSIGKIAQGFLGGLLKGLMGPPAAPTGAACSSDPSQYAAQQQQYQQQLQQYQYQQQQLQYQQQMSALGYGNANTAYYGSSPYGYTYATAQPIGTGLPTPPPVPCTPTAASNTCAASPAQPSGCTGTLRPITTQQSNGVSCTTGWQCVPGNGGVTPTAQLSCKPQVADVGSTVLLTYGCTNATDSAGNGFATGGATSGSTSTVLTAPPAGVNTATFGLQCRNQGLVGQATCDVQVSKPSIILTAVPSVVATGTVSVIGWITGGMNSCVISSPQLPQFTQQNANNTSVNGMATTTPISRTTDFVLNCSTIGGALRSATTTVRVGGPAGTQATSTISVSSSADSKSIARGATSTIRWTSTNAPAGSKMSLWLFDVRLNQVTSLIRTELLANGSYEWRLPQANDACDTTSNIVCGSDLVPGRQYGIEADLYTGTPASPVYGAQGYTPDVFTISQ